MLLVVGPSLNTTCRTGGQNPQLMACGAQVFHAENPHNPHEDPTPQKEHNNSKIR